MRTKCAISDAFVRDCVFAYCASMAQYVYSYQLKIVSDYAITQCRMNASEIAQLVRIVCSGLKRQNMKRLWTRGHCFWRLMLDLQGFYPLKFGLIYGKVLALTLCVVARLVMIDCRSMWWTGRLYLCVRYGKRPNLEQGRNLNCQLSTATSAPILPIEPQDRAWNIHVDGDLGVLWVESLQKLHFKAGCLNFGP